MADERKNPLIGAFRTPPPAKEPVEPPKLVVEAKAPTPTPVKADEKKPSEPIKPAVDAKAPAPTPAKAVEKKSSEPIKPATDAKAPATAPVKADEKKPAEPAKPAADTKAPTPTGKTDEKNPAEPVKPAADAKAKEPAEPVTAVPLSEIDKLPGVFLRMQIPDDIEKLAKDIQKNGLKEPVVLRQLPDGGCQMVSGYLRMKAVEKNGEKTISAYVREVSQDDAQAFFRRSNSAPGKPLPLPGKAAAFKAKPVKETEPPKTPEPGKDGELPKDLHIQIIPDGWSETTAKLKLSELHPFKGHPFNVKDDQDMQDLVASVKQFGVLESITVIPDKEVGGYEIVSGHRRVHACQLAGLTEISAVVRNLDRDEATISMVDANLKRENITPMEKARAYEMKLEAMKHKTGRRSKEETLAMAAEGKTPMRADEQLAQQVGESRATIQRMTRLTKLTPELQTMVDEKKLPINTAADISYLKPQEQNKLADAIKREDKVPSGTQAAELKKASQAGQLTPEKIDKTVAPPKREQEPQLKVTFTEEELRPYFPDNRATVADAKRGVFEGLDLRKKAIERRQLIEAAKAEKAKKSPEHSR